MVKIVITDSQGQISRVDTFHHHLEIIKPGQNLKMDQNELFGPEVYPDRGPNCLAKMSETSYPDVLIHDLRNFYEFLTIRVSRLTVRLLSRE